MASMVHFRWWVSTASLGAKRFSARISDSLTRPIVAGQAAEFISLCCIANRIWRAILSVVAGLIRKPLA